MESAGAANLTMPKFFFEDEDEGMSNSNVFKMTYPSLQRHEENKRVNLFWLDDSYLNSHNENGSLKPDDKTRTFDEESQLSGKTGLSFKYSENDLLVDQIVPNSPASRTGKIAPGDTILGFANPADLDEQVLRWPDTLGSFLQTGLCKHQGEFCNMLVILSNMGLIFATVASQIMCAVKEETAPLEMIPELLFSGPPDTFIYLLMRPKAKPNERVIVPIRRKLPADFEQ